MRLRFIALALLASLLTSAEIAVVLAQEGFGPAAEPLRNPAAPPAPGSSPEWVPNPFRTAEDFESQLGQPGFAEATDQDLFGPISPNGRSSSSTSPSNQFSGNRRPTPTPVSTSGDSTRNSNPFSPRLARAAPIMGDSLAPSLQYVYPDSFHQSDYIAQLPTGGGATRRKIAENTGAFPVDRFIFNYNNFQNAVESFGSAVNVDRYTLGFEKTFLSSLCSVDVRFPLTANNDVSSAMFARNGSEIGNLSVALKLLLTSDEDSALVTGLVVDTPTGGGSESSLFGDTFLKLNNDALHLAPFLGFVCLHDGGITQQGFLQVDVPTNANGLTYSDTSPAVITTEFTEQTLLYVDYSFGKSIYQAGRSRRGQNAVERITALAELHYTTTLEDSDQILISTPLNNNFDLSSAGNRIDVVNLTLARISHQFRREVV